MTTRRSARVLAGIVSAIALAAACASPDSAPQAQSSAQPSGGQLSLRVLSSRAEHVSGGDALIEVVSSRATAPLALRVLAGGQPVQHRIVSTRGAVMQVLVSGLAVGPSRLMVEAKSGEAPAELSLTNHPITGPILSGPHLAPYECRTKESGLGDATDANCSAPTRFDWFYRTTGGAFEPLTTTATKPVDLATTTTIDGQTVPYIVRVESGVVNRSIYRIASLASAPPSPVPAGLRVEPTPLLRGWNGRLAVTFGGGCGTQYNQGTNTAASALSDLYLSRGFAYMNSTELVNQQHCNQVLQGETLMMLKEHFIEQYGIPKWTVGTGGSGGAIQQMVITQMYPGLLDGIQPSLAFPDSSMNTADCGLLQKFWREDGKDWSQAKKSAVEGYSAGTCGSWERSFVPVMTATNARGCALNDASLIYDPVKNPKGARCTVTDMRANVYGRDPKTGFARKPQDNVGVQYGLKGLNDGILTVDEFLTLNEKIGGNDIDGGFVATRSVGDPSALKAVYESGLINTFGGGLANVPILNYRGYTDTTTPGDIHDRHRDLTIRARLEKATGSSANQVIWVADRAPSRDKPAVVDLAPIALDTMTKWLDAMAADPAPLTPAKVVKHKPSDAVDAFWTPDGKRTNEPASWEASTSWNRTYPLHLEPRLVAGAPIANDVMKCQLKPVDFAAYRVAFTDAQQARLKAVFPEGVCDWSKPSVGYSTVKETYRKY